MDHLKFAYENEILPQEVSGAFPEFAVKRFQYKPDDYEVRLSIFMRRAPRMLNAHEQIESISVEKVRACTLSTDVISFDMETSLVVSPEAPELPELIDLFDICKCTDYVPLIQYKKLLKYKNDKARAELSRDSQGDDAIYLTIFRVDYMNDFVPQKVDDDLKSISEGGRVRKSALKIAHIEIRQVPGANEFRATVKHVSSYLLSVYKQILKDVFNGALTVDDARVARTEIHTIQTLKCELPQSVFKDYVLCTDELDALIQCNDRRLNLAHQHSQNNHKYILKTALASINIMVYNNTEKNVLIRAAHKDARALDSTCLLISRIILYCAEKYSTLIRDRLESVYGVNINAQYARAAEDIEYMWYVPRGVMDFKMYDRYVSGYERRCQKRQPVVVGPEFIDEKTMEDLREKKFGRVKIGKEMRDVMYFKTTDNHEYILYCKHPTHRYPVLVAMTGQYASEKYPIMPCCNSAPPSPELSAELHSAYTKYLNGEIDLDSLYKTFGSLSGEKPLEHVKGTMSICAKKQSGELSELGDVYDILKYVFGRADFARYGVVDASDKTAVLASLLHAVHYAMKKEFISKFQIQEGIKSIRQNIHLCAQELYQNNLEFFENFKNFKNFKNFPAEISPAMTRALENLYQTHIILIEYTKGDSRFYSNPAFGCLYKIENYYTYSQCVLIIKNHGKEFSYTPHAVYEPVYVGSIGKGVFMHDMDSYTKLNTVLNKLYAAPVNQPMNAPTSYIQYVANPVPRDYSVLSQAYDSHNKTRFISLLNKITKQELYMYTDPLPSMCSRFAPPPNKYCAEAAVIKYIDDLGERVQSTARTSNGFIIDMRGVAPHPGYSMYCRVSERECAEQIPELNIQYTNYDLYTVARALSQSIKDNLLITLIQNENDLDRAASRLKYTDNLKELMKDGAKKRASNLAPKFNNDEHIGKCRYYMRFFDQTGEADKPHTVYKPNRHVYNKILTEAVSNAD